jgi:hypothetical protein
MPVIPGTSEFIHHHTASLDLKFTAPSECEILSGGLRDRVSTGFSIVTKSNFMESG